MNILNLNFTGNLTSDATKTDFPDKEKTVINFTVAVNFNDKETIFFNCAYWVKFKKPEEGKKTLLDYLKKGKSVSVFSDYMKFNKSTNEETKMTYENLTIGVRKLDIFNS